MRVEFPKKVKAAAWRRCGGFCEECLALLRPGKFEFDHVNPSAMTGEAILENCKVLCKPCHALKTPEDVGRIAKAKRQEAAHIGAKKRKGRPLPGTRASGWRKRMDGTVVRRD